MAKNKNKKIPRKKKKALKKEYEKNLLKANYNDIKINKISFAELEQINKKAVRNIRQNERRKSNLDKWVSLGIDTDIISRFDLRNKNPDNVSLEFFELIKRKSKSEKARKTKERNQQERYNKLIKHGYTPAEINPLWIRNDTILYEILGKTPPNKVYISNIHLALCFDNVRDGIFFNTSRFKEWTFEKIKEEIEIIIKGGFSDVLDEDVDGVLNNPDDSGQMAIFIQVHSGDEEENEEFLNAYGERGYNLKVQKLTDRRFYRLLNRNDWTMREFAELVLCVISQIKNTDVRGFLVDMEVFIQDGNLPFWEVLQDSNGILYTDILD